MHMYVSVFFQPKEVPINYNHTVKQYVLHTVREINFQEGTANMSVSHINEILPHMLRGLHSRLYAVSYSRLF